MKIKLSVLSFILLSIFGGAVLIDLQTFKTLAIALLGVGLATLMLFPALVDLLENK